MFFTISKDFEKLLQKYEEKIKRGFLRLIILRLFFEQVQNREYMGYHGWAIKQKIIKMSDGRWDPSSGSIYPILKEFSKDGLIEKQNNNQDDKIVYKITDLGQRMYSQLENISPLVKSHRDDFSRRVPEEFLKKGFANAQEHRSLEELEIMKERFEIFVKVLDEMINNKKDL